MSEPEQSTQENAGSFGQTIGKIALSPLESVCEGAEALGDLPRQLREGDLSGAGKSLLDIGGAASTIVTGGADPAALAKGAAAKGIAEHTLKPGEIVLGQSCLGRVFDLNAKGAPLTATPWLEQEMKAANSPRVPSSYSAEGMPEPGSQLPATSQPHQPRPAAGMGLY